MSTTQSTAPRTVTAKSGMVLPATIDQHTDLNLGVTAIAVYHKQSGSKCPIETAMAVTQAMQDSSAVVVLYTDVKGDQAARVLWPNSITLTKDNNIVCRAFCTLRREWKSFRLDRMLTCHALTTPDDVLALDEAAA